MRKSSRYYDLKWIVCAHNVFPGNWEEIAAFNVDRVAITYAKQCANTNFPQAYRVLQRTGNCYVEVYREGMVI